MPHTIVLYRDVARSVPVPHHATSLYQPTRQTNSRTFSDFENIGDAMNGLFERRLKADHPRSADITYDVADLFKFLDSLEDLSLLLFHEQRKAYQPFGADWIKNKLYVHLKGQQMPA
eukprot:gene46630-57416_t